MKVQPPGSSTCGPIALLNAYYYLHKRYPPNVTTRRLSYSCNTSDEYGTEIWEIEDNKIIELKKKTFDKEKILNLKAFIMLFYVGNFSAHYVFVEKDETSIDPCYNVYNYGRSGAHKYTQLFYQKDEFIQEFFKLRDDVDDYDYPIAWELL